MDAHSAPAPAVSAPVTHRLEVRAGTSGRADSARPPFVDIEILPSRDLPAVMELQLDIDQSTRTVIGRIVNPETGEIVKQIPTEEMVHLMARNAELLGALLNKKA